MPGSPIVKREDVSVIQDIIDAIVPWYFVQSDKGDIEVTIRSNLIKTTLFHEILTETFRNDLCLLPELVQKYDEVFSYRMINSYSKGESAYMYVNYFSTFVQKHQIIVYNRILASAKTAEDMPEHYRAQAVWVTPSKDVDYAIAPKGVMIEHTSVAIHNPILWLSHKDFKKTLLKAMQKQNFSFLKFSKMLIAQNLYMHDWLHKNVKEDVKLTNEVFMQFFEEYRPKMFKDKAKTRPI